MHLMKRFLSPLFAVFALTALTLGATPVQGAVIAFEDFEDYTSGVDLNGLNGGTGWTNAWATFAGGNAQVADGVTGMFGNVGRFTVGGTWNNLADRDLVTAQTGTVYIGMLLQVSDYGDDSALKLYANNNGGSSFNNGAGGGLSGFDGAGALSPRFVAQSGGGGAQTTERIVEDTTYALIFRISKDASSNYNTVDLFIDQAVEGTPDATDVEDSTASTIGVIHFRAISHTGTSYVDNITVATTYAEAYASIVPEPGSMALLGIAGLCVLRCRHRAKAVGIAL